MFVILLKETTLINHQHSTNSLYAISERNLVPSLIYTALPNAHHCRNFNEQLEWAPLLQFQRHASKYLSYGKQWFARPFAEKFILCGRVGLLL